jgi:hypothetical protein
MPIYLVRWSDLSASLVRARHEDDLIDTLDQVANPDGCEWSVYQGPLFIDFRLPAEWRVAEERPGEPVTPDQVVVGDVGRMATEPIVETLELSLAGEDGLDTGMAILRAAFPAVHAAIETLIESEDELASEGVLPEATLREALHGELVRRLHWSWRHAQLRKKTDALSALARHMDSPVALVRKYAELARGRRPNGEADEPTPGADDRGARRARSAGTATDAEHAPRRREPLFTVSNRHTAACGEPPAVDGDAAGRYVGYFANEYGEQAIYTYDHDTGEATVRMGDAGWQDAYRVRDGQVEGLLLGEAEAMWLRACWLATGALQDGPTPGSGGGTAHA